MNRVLAIDPSEGALCLLKETLTRAGYSLCTASTAGDALRHIRAEPFNLVITDLEVPDAPGSAVVTQLRAESMAPDVPVLALTNHADRARLREAGIDMWIGKPFGSRALLNAVSALIG
jgi:DNA-binding response OmpR family regulator